MARLIVVEGDPVEGTDTHTVTGTGPPPPNLPFAGTADYPYAGRITDSLSTFVKVAGRPIALVSSGSTLNAGETAPGGGHHSASGTNFLPTAPVPVPSTLQFAPAVTGKGLPNASAGSVFLTVGGTKVLLDADKIDTCDNFGSANSTVTASGQAFVNCSG